MFSRYLASSRSLFVKNNNVFILCSIDKYNFCDHACSVRVMKRIFQREMKFKNRNIISGSILSSAFLPERGRRIDRSGLHQPAAFRPDAGFAQPRLPASTRREISRRIRRRVPRFFHGMPLQEVGMGQLSSCEKL